MVTKGEVLRMLAELARLSALDEGSPQAFRVRAYERALHGIEGFPGEIDGMSKSELVEIEGVGGSTADKILELASTGKVAKLETLRGKYPPLHQATTVTAAAGTATVATR